MALERHLQFRRNNEVYPNYKTCYNALIGLVTSTTVNLADGEQVFGRYYIEGTNEAKVATLVGYVYKKGDVTTITISQTSTSEIGDDYDTTEYDEMFLAKDDVANVTSSMTVSEAVSTVEHAVDVLVDEVLTNEETIANTVDKITEAAGIVGPDGKIAYQKHTNDKFLSGATSLDSADVALSNALDAVVEQLTNDATSSADKINENLNDIATAVGLSGSTTATTLGFDTTNTSGDTYISGATNIINALDKLNDELEHRPRFSAVCENCLEIKDETLGVKIANVSDLTDVTANTILSGETAGNIHKNIIKESANGVYAFADLHYDTLNNKLTFINSNGSKDIKLSGINFLSGITYNNDTEELELWYQPMGESTFTATTVPMSDLIEEYSFLPKAFSATETSASTTNHNVTITSVRSTTGETKVYGDIDVFDCGTY